MCKVGFVDDDKSVFDDYQTRLKRRNIDLIFAEECSSKDDVVRWILNNNIKCVLVDYKLTDVYNFLGTDLVAYLNTELPDLMCIILTNYPEEGIGENLVISNLILDRSILSGPDVEKFVSIIKNAIDVFNKRLQMHLIEYSELKEKRDKNSISAIEQERFIALYKLLRAYDEVDDIPTDLLESDTNKKLDEILNKLDIFINKTK